MNRRPQRSTLTDTLLPDTTLFRCCDLLKRCAMPYPARDTIQHSSIAMTHVRSGEIAVAEPLYQFVNDQVLPGTGVEADAFWKGLSDYLTAFAPRNSALLDKRDMLQARIHARHRTTHWPLHSPDYDAFLRVTGYPQPAPHPCPAGQARHASGAHRRMASHESLAVRCGRL